MQTKKPSYVGPKTVKIQTGNFLTEYTFPTSIVLNNKIRELVNGPSNGDDLFYVKNGSVRLATKFSAITGLWTDNKHFHAYDPKDLYFFRLVFDDGHSVEFPMIGEVRLRIQFKRLRELVGKTVTENNGFLEITQQDSFAAYVKFTGALVSVQTIKG